MFTNPPRCPHDSLLVISFQRRNPNTLVLEANYRSATILPPIFSSDPPSTFADGMPARNEGRLENAIGNLPLTQKLFTLVHYFVLPLNFMEALWSTWKCSVSIQRLIYVLFLQFCCSGCRSSISPTAILIVAAGGGMVTSDHAPLVIGSFLSDI